MADELIDIVDEQNAIVGQMLKSEAHKSGSLHRCVVAQLINSKGEWLLVQQSPDRQDGGQFVSPVGGHVQAGEVDDDALKRESLEELGIPAQKFKKMGNVIFNREVIGRKENHFFVLYEMYSDEQPKLNHESVGIQSFSIAQLKKELKENPKKFGDSFFHVAEHFYPELL